MRDAQIEPRRRGGQMMGTLPNPQVDYAAEYARSQGLPVPGASGAAASSNMAAPGVLGHAGAAAHYSTVPGLHRAPGLPPHAAAAHSVSMPRVAPHGMPGMPVAAAMLHHASPAQMMHQPPVPPGGYPPYAMMVPHHYPVSCPRRYLPSHAAPPHMCAGQHMLQPPPGAADPAHLMPHPGAAMNQMPMPHHAAAMVGGAVHPRPPPPLRTPPPPQQQIPILSTPPLVWHLGSRYSA